MKNFGAKWLALAAVVGAVAGMSLNGCGGGGGGGSSKGGSGGSSAGGKGGSSTGGKGGSSAGSGGSSAGKGGSSSTAGTGGSATGGSATGGATGGSAGGTGGSGDGLPCPGFGTFTNANDMQGFGLNTFMGTSAGAELNLADLEGGTKATAAQDGTDGDPTPGSIKILAPFSDYNQFVDLQHVYGATMLQNFTGMKLHLRVKAELGAGYPSDTNPLGVQPYANTGADFGGFCDAYQNLKTTPGWNDYVFDLSKCGMNGNNGDASMVIAVGVSFHTGSGMLGSDGGTNTIKPTSATIHVDSFWLEGSCGGTGGTGGGTGGSAGGTGGTGGATGGSAGGTGGATGGSAGGTGGATGGSAGGTGGATGGSAGATGGTGGATGGSAGGTGGATGGSAGGTGGATGGSAGGTGGAAGGTGGTAGGTGGTAGAGGAPTTTLFDFESGVQGWGTTSTGAAVVASTAQHFDGAQSLQIMYPALDNANVFATVGGPALWPGTVLTFHAFLPVGFDTTGGTYFQAIAQADNYKIFDSTGNGAKTPVAGAWNTWTYTVPNTFPGGLQTLGFQLGDNSGGSTIAAGSVYIDAITATGGTQNCAVAVGTGNHTFETSPLDANAYQKDGSDADTVSSQSSDQANMGTGSWKVAFTALPAPAAGMTTSRRVFIAGPNIYCGQVATVHVYLPAASDGLTFQVFTLYNNYGKSAYSGPSTVTRGAWNTFQHTVPSDVGPGGIQRLGVQFNWTGTTAFTGNVYIDDVTW